MRVEYLTLDISFLYGASFLVIGDLYNVLEENGIEPGSLNKTGPIGFGSQPFSINIYMTAPSIQTKIRTEELLIEPKDSNKGTVKAPRLHITDEVVSLPDRSLEGEWIKYGAINDVEVYDYADIKGTKIVPNFGDRPISTTSTLSASDTMVAKLTAQDTNVNNLRINGDADIELNANIKGTLSVCLSAAIKGNTTIEGNTTISKELTAGNTTIDSTEFLLLPVGTTAQRPSNPVNGMMRYNKDEHRIEAFTDNTWGNVGGPRMVRRGVAEAGPSTGEFTIDLAPPLLREDRCVFNYRVLEWNNINDRPANTFRQWVVLNHISKNEISMKSYGDGATVHRVEWQLIEY